MFLIIALKSLSRIYSKGEIEANIQWTTGDAGLKAAVLILKWFCKGQKESVVTHPRKITKSPRTHLEPLVVARRVEDPTPHGQWGLPPSGPGRDTLHWDVVQEFIAIYGTGSSSPYRLQPHPQ